MEDVFDRHEAVVRVISGVYGAAFKNDPKAKQVVDGLESIERRTGKLPKLLIAKMGQDGHDRGAKVVASALADLGFDVVMGPLFQKPEEAAALAIKNDVDVVGASSLAAGHKTLVPELIAALAKAGRSDIRVIAGGVIPPQDYEFLRSKGVGAIFGPGSNIIDSAAEILRLLGHNQPPAEMAMSAPSAKA